MTSPRWALALNLNAGGRSAGRVRFGLRMAAAVGLGVVAAACGTDKKPGDAGTYSREKLLDPETCKECHQEHYKEWSGSMHAYAAADPVFLAMNARGQEETGGKLGAFCVGCHAPMAVLEKKTTDGLNLDTVPKALQGVTCYFCHNVKSVTDIHNNPLVLANDETMRGGIADPVPYKAHRSEYSTLHDRNGPDSSALCGACHDIVVKAHSFGQGKPAADQHIEQTYAEWRASTYSAPAKQLSCSKCHMPGVEGTIASPPDPHPPMPLRDRHQHYFWGVDTALSTVRVPPPSGTSSDASDGLVEFPERAKQQEQIDARLPTTVRLQLCVKPTPLDVVEVTLENVGAGHSFPSGASQDRRFWLELHVFQDVNGKETDAYQTGVVPAGASVTETAASDPGLWLFRDVTTQTDGSPAHMFWDVAAIDRMTISAPPADGNGVDYATRTYSGVETRVSRPSRVQATLWLEPIGLDVLDDLVASGHLEKRHREAMPRTALLPLGDSAGTDGGNAGRPITLEWTRAANGQDAEHPDRCAYTSPPVAKR